MKQFETFKQLSEYDIRNLTMEKPTCFNSRVNVIKYRITIEEIKESKDVYQDRLQKMWDECDNPNHWTPIKNQANLLKVDLIGHAGTKRKSQ